MLIYPFLGFSKSNRIRFSFRIADLIQFTVYDFHWLSATR